MMAWAPPGRRLAAHLKLLAIEVPTDRKTLSEREYRMALADRVSRMIEQEPDPVAAAKEAGRAFWDAGLLNDSSPRTGSGMEAAMDLVLDNLAFQTRLSLLDVRPPNGETWKVSGPNPEAATAIRETTLEEWVQHATYQPRD